MMRIGALRCVRRWPATLCLALIVAAAVAACGRRDAVSTEVLGTVETRDTATGPAAAPAPPARPDLQRFVGTWRAHHGVVVIEPSGQGEAQWRIYQWCSEDPTPPCDDVRGDEIISGGRARFTITAVEGDRAAGVVTESTDHRPPGPDPSLRVGPVTFTLGEHDDLEISGFGVVCGDEAPVGWCGA